MDQPQATDMGSTGRDHRFRAVVTSPYLWGGAATIGFYQALPHLPVYRELAERYFCAHPVEYVQTALFFVGLCLLIRKLFCLRPERAALRTCTSQTDIAGDGDATSVGGAAAATRAVRVLDAWTSSLPASQRQSLIARRCAAVRHYLPLRPSADSLETQLKDLEQRAGDDLHDSFALVQTINWAIPIMGFLGTVLGITMAIFNLDVNHLDASLSEVTFNLAVAFDTTAVALCHSLILVFLYLFVKSSEERMLAQVAEFCRRHVLPLVPASQSHSHPFMEAEAAAAQQLVARTGELIDSQTQMWTESVEALRQRWTSTLDLQQQALAQALDTGTQTTLERHAEQLADLRTVFVRALEQWSQQRSESDAALRAQETALLGRWEAGSTQLANVLAATQAAADERTTRMLMELTAQFDGWRTQLQTSTNSLEQRLAAAQLAADERASRMLTELATQFDFWRSQLQSATGALEGHVDHLLRQEERLGNLLERGNDVISLEEKLTDNLQALRAADTFEQTMHSLSAAVHLLTAHARQRAA